MSRAWSRIQTPRPTEMRPRGAERLGLRYRRRRGIVRRAGARGRDPGRER
jgi:hypothetical protein